MAWVLDEDKLGQLVPPPPIGIAPVDMPLGHTLPPLGTRVRAYEPVYGEAEFILAFGVAASTLGDLTLINPYTGLATRGLTTQRGLMGVAIANANTSTTAMSWYGVSGSFPVRSTAAAIGLPMYQSAGAGVALSTVSATNMVNNGTFGSVHNFTIPTKICGLTNGSTDIIVSNIDGLFVGQVLTGTGIGGGATITAIGYGGLYSGVPGPLVGHITVSVASTATQTSTVTFTATGFAVANFATTGHAAGLG
jgi:hypothetical protein